MDSDLIIKLGIGSLSIYLLSKVILSLINYIKTDKKEENGQSTLFINAITNQMEKLVSVIQISNNSEFNKMIEAIKISSARQDALSASIHELTAALIQNGVNEKNMVTDTNRKVQDIHTRIDEISNKVTIIDERTKNCVGLNLKKNNQE